MDKYEKRIILYCQTLQAKLLLKYKKGKEEHGEAKGLDINKEIQQELLDIINYHLMGIVDANPTKNKIDSNF